ncbi:sulfatase-like hydrolase/transferase [Streptomyces sp. NPDC088350]|uniref:sulfatase-like hydrolase/transferase n=1 Tax=Streptomyces sp. NPDC088350 TaxID=3365854 RepID=UPI003804E6C5
MTTVANEHPNILWIVSEDCPPRFGCYGDPLARTPHLDSLAGRGTLFERAYSPAPVCAPSRFSLITGIPSESHAPANEMRAVAPLPAWMRTYPEILREAGYYCTNNSKTDYNAALDEHTIWNACSPSAHWRDRPEGMPFLAVFNYDPTHESAVFSRRESDVDPKRVRLPAYLPDTPALREDYARYYGCIADMDTYVGTLLAQLDEDGLTEDTVVIHASDHGGVNPRSKRHCYDEGLHVPLIVAAPRKYAGLFPEPGTRVTAAVSTLRVTPTLIELAGAEVPDRMSETSLLRGDFDPGSSLAFGMRGRMDERVDMVRTVRDARFRYLRNFMPHLPCGQHQAFGWLAAGYRSWEEEYRAGRLDETRSAFWKPRPVVELYDTVADPDQVRNLAGDPAYAATEERLWRALRAHMAEVHDNGFLPEGAPAAGYDASRAEGAYPLERLLDLTDALALPDDIAVPRFVKALGDVDFTMRRWAAIGLLARGLGARPALDALNASARSESCPHVLVPVCESLAHLTRDRAAVARLAELAGEDRPAPVALAAVNALTRIDLQLVRPHREVVESAAISDDEYIRSAGRYLLLLLNGTYTPSSQVLDWAHLVAKVSGAAGVRPSAARTKGA